MVGIKHGLTKFLACCLCVVMLIGCIFTGNFGQVEVYAYDNGYPNTWKNTGNQVEDLIGIAMTQVGYWGTEYGTGTKYGAWYGNTYAPWCGMFISWCANQAGIPTSIIIKSARAIDFKNSGTYHYKDNYTPQRGDIVIYNPNDGNGYFFPSKDSSGKYTRAQHVAIVCSYNASTDEIQIVHGNATGDKVCYEKKKVKGNNAIQSFVTPNYTSGGGSSGGGSSSGGGTSSAPAKSDYINAAGVRLRSATNTSSSIVATLSKNTAVKIIKSEKDSSGGKWYYVEVTSTGKKGYVYSTYVTAVVYSESASTESKDNVINSDSIRLRDGPSTSGTNTLTQLSKGQVVTLISYTKDLNGDTWYKVSLTKGGKSYTGYVHGNYVTVKSKPSNFPYVDSTSDTISQDAVNLRKKAGLEGEIITTLNTGQVVKISAAAYDDRGDVWYKVSLTKGGYSYSGYVSSTLITLKTDKSKIKFENSMVTVSFDANGGSSAPSSVSCGGGSSFTLPATFPNRSDYIFAGWAETSSASKKTHTVSGSYSFSNNITLYAVWLSSSSYGCYDVNDDYMLSRDDFMKLRDLLAMYAETDSKVNYNSDADADAADLCILKKKLSEI